MLAPLSFSGVHEEMHRKCGIRALIEKREGSHIVEYVTRLLVWLRVFHVVEPPKSPRNTSNTIEYTKHLIT